MKSKFKVGDIVKYYYKNNNYKFYEQIIEIQNNKYKIKQLYGSYSQRWIEIRHYENENYLFSETELLTSEDKLELL